MKRNFFALGFAEHRLWGNLLIAHRLEKVDASSYYVVGEVLLKNEESASYLKLTPMQQKIVNIIDEYNDVRLHKLFSKKRTVKEFQDTVEEESIRNHIRPYIEKRLHEAFKIAAEQKFQVFLKYKTLKNIFDEDFLTLHLKPVDPYFHFQRTEENTVYRLSILDGNKPVDLLKEHAELVSNSPAIALLNTDVFFIKDIEGKRLLPFFNKREIVVPKTSEKKYFKSFVANTLRDFNAVETSGFSVEDIQPSRQAFLTLEQGLGDQPAWILSLKYKNVNIFPSSKQKRFLHFSDKQDHYHFIRFSRDYAWEDQLEEVLEEIGLRSRDRNVFSLRFTKSKDIQEQVYEAINFTNDNFDFLAENGIQIDQKLEKNYFLNKINISVQSEEKEDWFDLKAVIQFGEYEIPFVLLKNHILEGERLYVLPDGTYAVIPEDWMTRYKPLFEFGKIEEDRLQIHKQHFSQVDSAMRKQHASTIGDLEKLNRLEKLPELAPPVGLHADLRDYQVEGYAWMWLLQENGFGGCLADDMGLGKTLQTIAILQKNKEAYVSENNDSTPEVGQLSLFSSSGKAPTSLIVVPSSLIQNWVNEINRFAPGFKILVHAGINREKSTMDFERYDVIISSYHTVRQDIDFFRDYQFHYVILDESQMIKNPHSKLYRAMTELEARHKLVLTGTPIENSLTDLWSQINFVNEGLLGTLSFFKKKFVKSIEKKKNKEQELRLKELINPFILRRTKEEVARELPPVYEQYRYCNMTDEQKRLYEEEKSMVRNSLLENLEAIGLEKSTLMVLKALTRLRQISNHPAMVEEDYIYGSGKYDEVYRNIESVVSEGHKVLVFSSFVKHLDIYANQFKKSGWKYAWLTGSTRDRAGEVKKFQEDPQCPIFLISLKAGGVGLNLTAADYVFILDPWWNPAAEMQALSRSHRIGQDKSVFVYRFISNHTVEEKIQRLQLRKSELAKTFVTSNNPLKDMKREDVLDLFS